MSHPLEKNGEDSLEKEKSQVDIDANEGWILLTKQRCDKSSLQKESLVQPIRRKMVKQKSIKRQRKAKVEVHHYQKSDIL